MMEVSTDAISSFVGAVVSVDIFKLSNGDEGTRNGRNA